MPATTPVWDLVHPASGEESPNMYTIVKALADSVEAALTELAARTKSGDVASGSIAAGATADVVVNFATAFPVGVTPRIELTRLVTTSSPEVMNATVIARSNTGFTVRFKNTFSGSLNWTWMWTAHGEPV